MFRANTTAVIYDGQSPCGGFPPSLSCADGLARFQNRALNTFGSCQGRSSPTERYSNEMLSIWLEPCGSLKIAASSGGACAASCAISDAANVKLGQSVCSTALFGRNPVSAKVFCSGSVCRSISGMNLDDQSRHMSCGDCAATSVAAC